MTPGLKKFLYFITIILCVGLLACSYTRYFVSEKTTLSETQWRRFLEAYRIIKTHYVTPVSDQTLINNAIRGMLEGLDPYSTYLNEKDMAYLQQLTSGEYAGIGIEVMPDDGALKVITPIDNSPAQKAGIQPGDMIIEVNQKPLATLSFQEMIQSLRGAVGSEVSITVIRTRLSTPLHFTLIRTRLDTQNIKSKLYPHHIGYIRIAFFQEDTADKIKKAIIHLEKENQGNLKGVILDLRNNPGGLLDSAVGVSNLFLNYSSLGKNHLIVTIKNRTEQVNYSAKTNDIDILHNIPMVILINKGSASAAEIVAGALHDHHRAILVGTQTFGKGSVQAVIPFDDKKSAIKLTIALYYTPDNHLINHIGIQPDIEVKAVNTLNDKTDFMLSKALKILDHD